MAFSMFSLALFFIATGVQAQTGTIKGRVTDTNDTPVADINIVLQGTNYGAATNDNGRYKIDDVSAGTYDFVVTGVGYEPQRKTIVVESSEIVTVHVTLSKTDEKLQEIVVSDSKVNKFNVETSDYVAKMPIRKIENPQVYHSITAEMLDDQAVTNFNDALNNAPGVFKLWESTGRGGDGAGYYSLRGLGLGFGGNYASENLIMNRENTGQFSLPSFTVFNAGMFYNTENYRLNLKVNNLTDVIYYNGWSTVNPQQPRAVTASFSYKF